MGADHVTTLGPGFRFHPTDEELVVYYLKRKVVGKPFRFNAIAEIDLYKSEPWDLPCQSRLKTRDLEWYFFTSLDKKYGHGGRTNRSTGSGYWKTTGKDSPVHHNARIVGARKTLVYHEGRAPSGKRTNWVMHEYRLDDDELGKCSIPQDAFVLCRIFQKSGAGPKNGEQYGAPFVEEEWEDDNPVLVPLEKERTEVSANYASRDHDRDAISSFHSNLQDQMPQVPVSRNTVCSNVDKNLRLPEETEAENVIYFDSLCEQQDVSLDLDGDVNHILSVAPYMLNENYIELNDLTEVADQVAPFTEGPSSTEDLIYYEALDYKQFDAETGYLELNDLVDTVNSKTESDSLDEYLKYIGSFDDSLEQYLALDSTRPLHEEEEKASSFVNQPQVSEFGGEGSSSTKRKADLIDEQKNRSSFGDFHLEDNERDNWNISLRKKLHSMLDSIPSSSAYAAEGPVIGRVKFVGQGPSSQVHLDAFVHVEPAMIYKDNLKTRYAGLMLRWMHVSCLFGCLTIKRLIGKSVPVRVRFVAGQVGLFLCSVYALLFALSCQIVFFIYSRL